MSYSNGIGDWKNLNPITPDARFGARQANNQAKTAEAKAAGRPEADETKLSSTGGLIAQALAGSDVRSTKVEALQKAEAGDIDEAHAGRDDLRRFGDHRQLIEARIRRTAPRRYSARWCRTGSWRPARWRCGSAR